MSVHVKTILFTVACVFGIIYGHASPYATELFIVSLIVVGTLLVFIWCGAKYKIATPLLWGLLFLFVGLCLGLARIQFHEEKISYVCTKACTVEVVVTQEPEQKDSYQKLIVLEKSNQYSSIEVYAPLYPQYAVGSTLSLYGEIHEPSFIFPHDNKKGFDYVSYLNGQGVGSQMMFPKIVTIDTASDSVLFSLKRVKSVLVNIIDQYVTHPASSIASGMLFGAHSIPDDMKEVFRVSGISHIVVLSGFNIVIVISFTLYVLSLFPIVLRVAVAACGVILFVCMVGGEASVIRATLMALVSLTALFFGRQYIAKQALLLSLLAVSLYDPKSVISDVSLYLSFIATAGLVYVGPVLKEILFVRHKDTLFHEGFITTVSAYVATLPYIMYTFGTVSLYALVTNSIVVPLVPLAMFMTFLTTLFSFIFSPVAYIFGWGTSLIINGIIFIAETVTKLPYALTPSSITFGQMMVMYFVMGGVLVFLSRKKGTLMLSPNGVTVDETRYKF